MASIEQLQEEWGKDCVLEKDKLDEHSLKTAYLHSKYYKHLFTERSKLKHFENEYAQTKLLKYELFMHGADERHRQKGWKIPQKTIIKADLPMWLAGDPDLILIDNKIVLQREKVEFLISVLKTISERSYAIRNAISFMQFSVGQ